MTKIGIFTKIGARGGSEHRTAEICNMFSQDYEVTLLCEGDLNSDIHKQLVPGVRIVMNAVKHPETFQELDYLLVINSDSYSFSKLDYWQGKTKHHDSKIDLTHLKRIGFLFNFCISPAQKLGSIAKVNPNVVVISTNQFYLDEIRLKADKKFKAIADYKLPCMQVNSPIGERFFIERLPHGRESNRIIIGRHSLDYESKFNDHHLVLCRKLAGCFGDRIAFDFIGVPKHYWDEMSKIPGMHLREKFSIEIPEFLKGVDISLYYTAWDRREPWPRVTAEAMAAGCCVVTNGIYGMAEQIRDGRDGYLCQNDDEFFITLAMLLEHPEMIRIIGNRARLKAATYFSSKAVYAKMRELFPCEK